MRTVIWLCVTHSKSDFSIFLEPTYLKYLSLIRKIWKIVRLLNTMDLLNKERFSQQICLEQVQWSGREADLTWGPFQKLVILKGLSSTIRTPYLCKLFLDYFITFVFLVSCFGQNVKLNHSCLAGVAAVWRLLFNLLLRVSLQKKPRIV